MIRQCIRRPWGLHWARSWLRRWNGGVLIALLSTPVLAVDYQINGFVAQGFAYSDGNNYFGESTEGSFDLREIGLGASAQLTDRLLVSGSILSRRNGDTGDDDPEIDYLLADYQLIKADAGLVGVRAGRVRNPIGFYNESRDVVFTRPSITLPSSIYFDGRGFRDFQFSSDGGQLYGVLPHHEDQVLSLDLVYGKDVEGSDATRRALFGTTDVPVDLEFSDNYFLRVKNSWFSGTIVAALSYLHTTLEFESDGTIPFPAGELEAELYVASLAYNAEKYSLTAEYGVTESNFVIGPIESKNYSDGGYLQGEYRFRPQWSAFLRLDGSFSSRNDRDGRDFKKATGFSRYSQFGRDTTIGARWKVRENLELLGEYHHISGFSTAPIADNRGMTREDGSDLLLLMVAWRFHYDSRAR